MARPVVVDDALRRRVEREGDACRHWLAGLDDLIGGLEREWAIEVGAPMTGGTAAFVVDATAADGSPAVLKLVMPAEREGREDLAHEVLALRVAGGRGCVRVLRADLDHGAVLLERLGRQLAELDYPVGRQLRIICDAVAPVWTVPPDPGLPGLDDKGRFLADYISSTWAELDRPCSPRVVDLAVACAERRAAAFDPTGGGRARRCPRVEHARGSGRRSARRVPARRSRRSRGGAGVRPGHPDA